MRPTLSIRGFHIYKTALDIGAQRQLVDAVRSIVKAAPLMRPQTPSGRQMSVRMTSAGRVGWTAAASGYQYATRHPSGVAWPAIPRKILDVWSSVTCDAPLPDSCLINFYDEAARMGLHRDHDEADFQWPGLEGMFLVATLVSPSKKSFPFTMSLFTTFPSTSICPFSLISTPGSLSIISSSFRSDPLV